MCSRRARIRPSVLLQPVLTPEKLAPPTMVSTISSSKTDISPTTEVPNRKRLKNWRRPTGPLSPEDLELAVIMVTTGKHAGRGTSENRPVGGEQQLGDCERRSYSDMSDFVVVQEKSTVMAKSETKWEMAERLNSGGKDENESFTAAMQMDNKVHDQRRLVFSDNTFPSELLVIDYKKLYENEKAENDYLRNVIAHLESALDRNRRQCQDDSGDPGVAAEAGNTQAMKRRLARLEDELKAVDSLRADNQRLKEENGALIRVISKLSK